MSAKILFIVWGGLAALATMFGGAALIDFDSAPGKPVLAPSNWPISSSIPRADKQAQLLVFAHPKCSCTAATLEELLTLQGAKTSVLFFRPGRESNWVGGSSWTKAQHLENVTVSWDDGGAEAKRFGATTSGSVLLYSSKGELLFAGGVTASRGHVGENFGLSRLQAALQTGHPDALLSPIFGCGLTSSKLRRKS